MKGSTRQPCPRQARLSGWTSTALVALVVLLAFLCSRYFFQLMLIQGESMVSAYHNLQLVVLDKRADMYAPGEVVAFHCDGLDAVLVKRVVAGPGDTAWIADGTLYVDEAVSEVFPGGGIFQFAGLLEETVALGEEEYLVIGDNIEQSKDSRYEVVGIIQAESILGRIPGSARTAPSGEEDS